MSRERCIKRKKLRLKRTCKKQAEDCMNATLTGKDVLCRSKYIVGINQIATRLN